MKKIVVILFFLVNSFIAKSDGYLSYPWFCSFSHIEYFTKVTILEKSLVENVDTCINGKIIIHPTSYNYKCRLVENLYGVETDSIFYVTYSDPEIYEYNDSCEVTISYWLLTSLTGIERDLNIGEEVYFCFGYYNRVIAAIRTLSELDIFLVKNIKELKNNDRNKLWVENSKAIGKTRSNEFCKLQLTSESSINEDIPTVILLRNGEVFRYSVYPLKKLTEINPGILWEFKISKNKIIIKSKHKKYKLHIKK